MNLKSAMASCFISLVFCGEWTNEHNTFYIISIYHISQFFSFSSRLKIMIVKVELVQQGEKKRRNVEISKWINMRRKKVCIKREKKLNMK